MVTPVFVNPFEREVIMDLGDRYEKGFVWFEPAAHFRPAGFGVATNLSDPIVQRATQTPRAKTFLQWSRFPFAFVEASQRRIWLNDYRYSSVAPLAGLGQASPYRQSERGGLRLRAVVSV
jgi:hypothetical protein